MERNKKKGKKLEPAIGALLNPLRIEAPTLVGVFGTHGALSAPRTSFGPKESVN